MISIFGSINASFLFDLSNIAEYEENYPNIIQMSIDDSNNSNRLIGTYPVDYYSSMLDTTVAPSLKTPAPLDLDVKTNCAGTHQNKKRRTAQVKAIAVDMTIDEIIEIEISGFKKEENRAQFRKTLQLIARNDREAFDADEINFKTVFGKLYASYKKDESDFYLIRFIIMFGADQLFTRNFKKTVLVTEKSYRLAEAFNYLIKTKPFNVLIDLLGLRQTVSFNFGDDTYKIVTEIVNSHYLNLPFFKKLFLESLHARSLDLYLNVFKEEDEKIAFNMIPELIKKDNYRINTEYNSIRFHDAVLHYPEYYLALDDASKLAFISICFVYDDLEIFEKIFELYPEIISHVKTIHGRYNIDETILHEAIRHSAIKCIRFLCEVAPELITFSTPNIQPALILAFSKGNSSLYEIFYNMGYTESYILKTDNGMELNMIQYAFRDHCRDALTYFIKKIGLETVRNEILNVWKTVEQILIHTLNYNPARYLCNCINLVINLFNIDVNATYRYKNLEGNVMIYFEQQYKQSYYLIPGLNNSAPVYMIDPVTGTKNFIFDWINN